MYALILLALAYPLFKLAEFFYEEYTSPLNRLPGPKSTSWLYGNFKEIWENVRIFTTITLIRFWRCSRISPLFTRNGSLLMALPSNIKILSVWATNSPYSVVVLALNDAQITRFFTIDAKAITHVLMNSHIYEKPAATRYELTQVLGDGKGLGQLAKWTATIIAS